MAIIGQGIDRVDGRLKVAGRAHYAAEFAVPNVVHALLVQSTIGTGTIIGFDLDAAHAMPGVLAIITPDNAPKLPIKDGPQQMVRSPLLQDRAVYFNGQHVAIVVAQTLDQADAAAAQVRVRYRRDEPVTSMDAVLAQAYPPKKFRNGERPPEFASRRSRCGVRHRGGEGRCHLHHADGTSQSDGTSRDDRAVGRQSADRMDHDTGYLRDTANARRIVRYRRVGCARDLPLSRRRLRLQGQHVAAGDARRDGS